MIGSCHANVRPHNRRPLQCLTGLFTRKLAKSQPVDAEKNPSPVKTVTDSNSETTDIKSEKDGIDVGAALRNEKIENARSIARAARQQRKQNTAASSNMHDALLERLEAKLLTNEMKCMELRKLRVGVGIPVSLSLLSVDFHPEKFSSVGDTRLLEKLEALLLARETEGTKFRRLLEQARKRGEPPAPKGTTNRVSLATHLEASNSGLRRQASSRSKKTTSSSRSKKSVLRKQKSSRSTKSVSWE
jgi:hypothetical protein